MLLALLLSYAAKGHTTVFGSEQGQLSQLQGTWIAAKPSSFLYRLNIAGDKVTIDQSPQAQPIHGYMVLPTREAGAVDLVLEHAGDAKGIFRMHDNQLDLCIDSSFSGKRPSEIGQSGFETIRLEKLPQIRPLIESPSRARKSLQLLRPTGQYEVGRIAFHVIDSERDDPNFTDLHQHYREWAVHLWYPALRSQAPRADYYPNFAIISNALGKDAMADELEDAADKIDKVGGNSKLDAAPLITKFPLIIFMPGQGYSSYHYTALIEDLVSHGYVVAGIEDTFFADAVVFENERIEKFAADRWQQAQNYTETIAFDQSISRMLADDALDTLRQLRGLPARYGSSFPNIDFSRVGVMGHSIGARGMALATQMNSEIRCCVDLDGFSPGGTTVSNFGGYEMHVPFMLIRSNDQQPPNDVMAQAKMTVRNFGDWSARAKGQRYGFYQRTGSEAFEADVTRKDFNHASFSDVALIVPGAQQVEKTMGLIRNLVTGFFDRELKGRRAGFSAETGCEVHRFGAK